MAIAALTSGVLVGVEDERFFEHGAIDPIAIGRATLASTTSSRDPGGSTIAQQLAKVLYLHGRDGFMDKLRAIALAARLEDRLSWDQATLLAGLIQAPTLLDPLRHPARARRRQAQVVSQLAKDGVLVPQVVARLRFGRAALTQADPVPRLVSRARQQ